MPAAFCFYTFVIARPAWRAVASQPLDWLGALSVSKRLDCFVIPQSGTPRNDSPKAKGEGFMLQFGGTPPALTAR